ncbi:MAG TPA: RidA family protein [Chloroflexota bacterium]|nr:RidA family protein [Chloroflexota bacterium]
MEFRVIVASGKLVFIAGQLARDESGKIVGKGDMAAQIRQTCENIRLALASVGATFDNVVESITFVTNMAEYRKRSDVRRDYFGAEPPTSTTIGISELADPDGMIEIRVTAVVDE